MSQSEQYCCGELIIEEPAFDITTFCNYCARIHGDDISGLDPKATAQMYEIIEQLHREGITIIMISHDVGVALADATHILHIGKHLFFGTKESYLHSGIGQAFLSEEEPK